MPFVLFAFLIAALTADVESNFQLSLQQMPADKLDSASVCLHVYLNVRSDV